MAIRIQQEKDEQEKEKLRQFLDHQERMRQQDKEGQ